MLRTVPGQKRSLIGASKRAMSSARDTGFIFDPSMCTARMSNTMDRFAAGEPESWPNIRRNSSTCAKNISSGTPSTLERCSSRNVPLVRQGRRPAWTRFFKRGRLSTKLLVTCNVRSDVLSSKQRVVMRLPVFCGMKIVSVPRDGKHASCGLTSH